MSEEIVFVWTMRYDRAKADASNAALFEPEFDDPVQGDGESLLVDLVRDLLFEGDCGEQPVSEALIATQLTVNGREISTANSQERSDA